jgi:hypothetical protein
MTDVCSTCRTPWRDAVALRRRVEQLEAEREVGRAALAVVIGALYEALGERGGR